MRWVILTDDYPPLDGGIATWTRAVAAGLHRSGHEVLVLARERPGLGEGDDFVVRGVSGPSFGRYGGMWLGAAAWLELQEGDVVLATTWGVATHVVGRCDKLGIPLHVVFHGSDLTRRPRSSKAFHKVCSGALCWTVSRYLQDVLLNLGHRSEVLPAPLELPVGGDESRLHAPGLPSQWIMVGRATSLKGGDRFVRLVAAAHARGTLVGDGPELDAWRQLVADTGADVQITGHLPREQVLSLYAEHDLAVLLPREDTDGGGAEGFGLVLVEAALAGVAGVGCDTGGVPEALGPHGLALTDPDDPQRSLDEITAWYRADLGERCRRWAMAEHGTSRVIMELVRASHVWERDRS